MICSNGSATLRMNTAVKRDRFLIPALIAPSENCVPTITLLHPFMFGLASSKRSCVMCVTCLHDEAHSLYFYPSIQSPVLWAKKKISWPKSPA